MRVWQKRFLFVVYLGREYFGDVVSAVGNQVFVTAGAVLYASVRLLYFKNLEVNEYIVLINAIMTTTGILVADAGCISRIQDNHLYIENIREFMEYEPKIAESGQGKSVDKEELLLKMENVSFAYFGQDKEVLKDINLSISKKEKIVLVGENGAGKTTLVKLLMPHSASLAFLFRLLYHRL